MIHGQQISNLNRPAVLFVTKHDSPLSLHFMHPMQRKRIENSHIVQQEKWPRCVAIHYTAVHNDDPPLNNALAIGNKTRRTLSQNTMMAQT
jgi:hypothetical protein